MSEDDFFAQLTKARDAQRDPEPPAAEEVPFQVFRGPKGEDGRDGVDGKDGAPGRDGRDGVDGKDGADGARGPRGDRGPEGPAGPRGLPGPPGVSAATPVVVRTSFERDRRSGRITNVVEHLNDGSQRVRMVERGPSGQPTGLTLKG